MTIPLTEIVDRLKEELSHSDYGQVVLTLTLHDSHIVKWNIMKQVASDKPCVSIPHPDDNV